jgi:NTP pyrophosphatase (non-canonical NTP hydrolase)
MTDTEKVLLYAEALDNWGIEAQVAMVMEETGEMLSALAKARRGRVTKDEIITELADVSIMMEQMAVYFGLDEFREEKERKLLRLKERLKEWKEKHNNE